MQFCEIELCSVNDPKNAHQSLLDFKLGKIQLTKHFSVSGICSLSVCKNYGKQLLLKQKSELNSGRVPLFVCECCGDLGCGALTVEIEKTENGIIWRNFGYECNYEDGISQSEYMLRTGEFCFEEEQYKSVIQPYA